MSAPLVAVLAAGAARRFGGGKLDADCAGRRLGRWVLAAVADAGLAPGIIVVPESPVPAFAAESGWSLVANPHAARGLASSVSVAARFAARREQDLLVLLADMALVSPAHLAGLAALGGLAATDHGRGRAGVPALFPHTLLDDLALIEGEAGAGRWLAGRDDLALLVPPAGSLADVDLPEDLAAMAAALSRRPARP